MQMYYSSAKKKLDTVSKTHCTIPLAKIQASTGTCKKPILEGHDRSKNLVIYITCSRISHILKFFSVSHLYYPRANQFDQIE